MTAWSPCTGPLQGVFLVNTQGSSGIVDNRRQMCESRPLSYTACVTGRLSIPTACLFPR